MKLKQLLVSAVGAAAISLGAALPASAAILADVVFVIDTSGSMGDDINQVKARIGDFNTALTGAGIDVQYGLVRYGEPPVASLVQDLTSFGSFTAGGSPFALLSANGGGTEDGSLAIQQALTASFRAGSVRNIVLITDEDDDNVANRPALQAALDATAARELINIIGNPQDDAGSYYRGLAPANGGLFFDILAFRNTPGPFFENFITVKLQEIINESCGQPNTPPCPANVPEPETLPLLTLGLIGLLGLRRRKVKVA